MIHQRKNRGHRTPRSLNPGKAIAVAICPIICSFYYLARALMHDVAGEIACAEGCAETISANVLKTTSKFEKKFKELAVVVYALDRICRM